MTTRRPVGARSSLDTQTMRLRNAADALVEVRAELAGRLAPDDAALPGLYAGRVLEQDDRYGTAAGLVVQGDGVDWASLAALELLARRGRRAHQREDSHPPGVTPLTCPLCAAAFAVNVRVVDGLRLRDATSRRPNSS